MKSCVKVINMAVNTDMGNQIVLVQIKNLFGTRT